MYAPAEGQRPEFSDRSSDELCVSFLQSVLKLWPIEFDSARCLAIFSSGGQLSVGVVLVLGFSNIFADALSMGVGEYLSSKVRAVLHTS